MTAITAFEQMVEKENHSTMGIAPSRRLEQIQNVLYMLEAFHSAARLGDGKTGDIASEEVRVWFFFESICCWGTLTVN